MQINYSFELAAVILMVIIFLHYFFSKQFFNRSAKLFGVLLVCSIMESSFHVLLCLFLQSAGSFPFAMGRFSMVLYFIFQALTYFIFFIYLVSICDLQPEKRKPITTVGSFLCAAYILLLLLLPASTYSRYLSGAGNYIQGYGNFYSNIYIILFTLSYFLLPLLRKKTPQWTKAIRIFAALMIIMGTLAIPLGMQNLLLIGFFRACIVMVIYLGYQNPNDNVDKTTGLFNELALQRRINEHLLNHEDFSLISVELLHFHNINSILGYETGNLCLKIVGSYFSELVGKRNVFRLNNNTFTLLSSSDKNDVQQKVDAISKKFKEIWHINDLNINLNPAIAAQFCPEQSTEFTDIIDLKNYLLFLAKKHLENPVLIADEAAIDNYHRRLRVEFALKKAIEEDSFLVYYQPIYSVEQQKITDAEALVRIWDDELGFIPTEEFIAPAEKNGRIVTLGTRVFEKTCQFIAEEIIPHPELGIRSIHVNISVIQCMQEDMAEKLTKIVEKYNIPPHMVNLEITEMAAVTVPELMLGHMHKLIELGTSFSLDDYGTGNSNCSYLIAFPFQKVKFDKHLVWSYFKMATAKTVLQNEFLTIKKLGIPIVAEGVETKEQMEEMIANGVTYLQGYYFSKPIPGKEYIEYVKKFNLKETDN